MNDRSILLQVRRSSMEIFVMLARKETAMNATRNTMAAALLLCALAGCHKPDDKRIGPAEQAGREIDKATEKAAVQLDKAHDQLSDAAKETGDKLNKAAGEAGQKLNRAAEVVGEKVERAGEKIQENAREAKRENGGK
jgi:hypothetical protein